jgi:hypothetical protein
MDAASLKQRLRRLTELGFIRRHIPGLASPIFAEKLRSVYWLNLNHLQLSPADDVVSVVVHKKAADQDIDYKFLAGVRLDRNSFLRRGGIFGTSLAWFVSSGERQIMRLISLSFLFVTAYWAFCRATGFRLIPPDGERCAVWTRR